MTPNAIRLAYTHYRHLLLQRVEQNFNQVPQPANLKYLADQLNSEELRQVYKIKPGAIIVHVLDRNEDDFLRNVEEGTRDAIHNQSWFCEFVDSYKALPSGFCPPSRDSHFVGAEFLVRSASFREFSSIMTFFADERFVKPGFGTAAAIKIEIPTAVDSALSQAIRKTLNDGQEVWPIEPSRFGAYLAAIIADMDPSLAVELVACERCPAVSASTAYNIVLQVRKGATLSTFPQAQVDDEDDAEDDTIKVGRVFLPANFHCGADEP